MLMLQNPLKGNENSTTHAPGITLTGVLDSPKEYPLLLTNDMIVRFQSNATVDRQKHRGFRLTCTPFGPVPPSETGGDTNIENGTATTKTTTMRPVRDLQSHTIYLLIDEPQQVNETWTLMKRLLAACANEYILAQNLSLTRAE